MTFKIPDITWDVGHFFDLLVYYVRGFVCTWMALRARNPSPSGLATLNPQSTCHGTRPGSKLAYGVRVGSLRATEPRARGKPRGRKRKNAEGWKITFVYTYIYGALVAPHTVRRQCGMKCFHGWRYRSSGVAFLLTTAFNFALYLYLNQPSVYPFFVACRSVISNPMAVHIIAKPKIVKKKDCV